MAAIYAPESVLNALFWRCSRGSIIILVWCLKSILGYTIYSVIYGDFLGYVYYILWCIIWYSTVRLFVHIV